MNHIPSLQANYTPVPNSFLQLAFAEKAPREELVVLLFLFSKTYGWKPEKGFVSIEDIAHEAGLTLEEARHGIDLALSHEQVLEMPLDPQNPDGRSMYLLHTLENRRFLEAYATASSDSIPIEGLVEAAPAPEPPPAPPAPAAGEPSGDMLAPEEMPVVEEEAGGLPDPAPPPAPSPPASETAPDPFADWGVEARTAEMVIRLLGRVPTKDEKIRLADAGATDAELIEAMGRLLEKGVDVYSSDLIVYEYEALQTAARREKRESELRAQREERMSRQRACHRCDGLGYFFVGVSGIQECECRKAAGA